MAQKTKVVAGYTWGDLIARGTWGKVRRAERHCGSCCGNCPSPPHAIAEAVAAAQKPEEGAGGDCELLTLREEQHSAASCAAVKTAYVCSCPCCTYAVKVFYRERLARKIRRGVEMLRQEYALVRSLSHPNIIRYHALDETSRPHKMYLFMDHCAGGSIASLAIDVDATASETDGECVESSRDDLTNGRTSSNDSILSDDMPQGQVISQLPPKEALECIKGAFKEMIEGLAYLHSHGVAHHDIKCENVLLDYTGHVRICDFGVAERFSANPDGKCRVYWGTPAFQPPEIVGDTSGDGFDGPAADMWAAGVVLYRMLCGGRMPFEGSTIFLVMQAIATTEARLPKCAADPPLRDLLALLLSRDPKARPTAAACLRHPALSSL